MADAVVLAIAPTTMSYPFSKPASAHLWSELEHRIVEVEILLARADQGIAALATLIAVWFSTMHPQVGIPLGLLCLVVLIVATAAHYLLTQGLYIKALRVLMPAMEIGLPGAALLLIAALQSPGYALGSWVPPQLFCLFIAASILRLQPIVPFVMGTIAALEFWVIYWFAIRPEVLDDGQVLHQLGVQVTRTLSLFLIGVACAIGVMGVRKIISRTGATIRSSELFGKYRLQKEIGSGGMGVVYEALYCPEGGFERKVAVKLIHPHLAADEEFIEKFREEARIGARLTHPNMVSTLDFGTVDQTYFLAMEFVNGPTLGDILQRSRSTGEAVPHELIALIGAEVCDGLFFAHHVARDTDGHPLRVLHRDLSPANMLIDQTGVIKILDFGVARTMGKATAVRTSNLVGKPSYLAPEQLQDHRVDERSDLWSLAVVLYELVCNTRLFKRNEEGSTMMAVVDAEVPSPSSLCPNLPPEWDVFFARALHRTPAQRYRNAAAFGKTLRAIAIKYGDPKFSDLAALARAQRDADELILDDPTEG